MKQKKNDLWKLDLLEVKYTKVTPRFSFTKKLLNARNNSHLLKKLPNTPNEAFQQIHALKSDLFQKKYHGSYKKLSREVYKLSKQGKLALPSGHVKELFQNEDFYKELITSKLIKLVQSALLTSNVKTDTPKFISEDLQEILTNKNSPYNPSHFFIHYCQNDKALNNYLSKLWNSKDLKKLCQEIEWGFKKIRGNFTKAELALHAHESGKSVRKSSLSDHDDIISGDGTGESSEEDDDSQSDHSKTAMDAEEAFDKFAVYDNMVAGSEDEAEFVADPNIDYNELTDAEPSEAKDSSDEASSSKTKSVNAVLPQLTTGYYSGDSEDESEAENDKVVKEATSSRKNRRGQRARQKIWEQKYGKNAKHVVKEKERLASERERKQQEFEERQKKRELKARLAEEARSSGDSSATRSVSTGIEKVHPSWEAKKKAEEKMKNVKFQGKKITFD